MWFVDPIESPQKSLLISFCVCQVNYHKHFHRSRQCTRRSLLRGALDKDCPLLHSLEESRY